MRRESVRTLHRRRPWVKISTHYSSFFLNTLFNTLIQYMNVNNNCYQCREKKGNCADHDFQLFGNMLRDGRTTLSQSQKLNHRESTTTIEIVRFVHV